MTGGKNKDITVQETNDSSILSKASIVNLQYFNDPFLKLFTTRVARRAPLIHWGYYVRAKAIDYTLQKFISQHQTEERIQIISLGAGFDSSYFRLQNKNELGNCMYFEVDFEEVVERKLALIQKHQLLKDLIGSYSIERNCLKSNNYDIIPCDLTETQQLEKYFEICQLDYNVPTLLFSECVLTYVEYTKCQKLLKWVATNFSNVIFSLYEQIFPDDGFGQVMINHFNKIQSPLKRIHHLKTISSHIDEFTRCGFQSTIGFDMNFFYDKYIPEEEKERMKKLEVFDEFEEWHLKCKHYCLVTAFKGPISNSYKSIFPNFTMENKQTFYDEAAANMCNPSPDLYLLQRYGHCCTNVNDNQYLISGGFGVNPNGSHEKLSSAVIFHLSDDGSTVQYQKINSDLKRLYHTVTLIAENKVFVFGGRLSPLKPCTSYFICDVSSEQLESDVFKDAEINPRWRHSACYWNGKVYIFGGRSIEQSSLNDLWCYDVAGDQWEQKGLISYVKPRHSHSMNIYKDNLVIYGGLADDLLILNDCLCISLTQTKQNDALPVNYVRCEVPLPERYSHTSHLKNDDLIICGGIDACAAPDLSIVILSLNSNTWKSLNISTSALHHPLMMHNHCSVLVDDVDKQHDSLIVLGGGGNCFSFGTYFNVKPVVVRWLTR